MRALRTLIVVLLAIAVPAGVAVALVEWTRGPERVALADDPATAATPGTPDVAATEGAGTQAGDWRELPPAPLDPRWGAFSVWTGNDLLVWGGYAWPSDAGDEGPRDDGAAFDGRQWTGLPEGPLPPVMHHSGVAAWTGEELLIAGGTGGDDGRTPLRDAAAYHPEDRTWRKLPRLPEPIAGGGWVGNRLIVIGAGDDDRRPVYALQPEAARWRELDPLPLAAATADDAADVHVQATDRHLLVVAQGEAWLFKPGDGWEQLPEPDDGVALDEIKGVARDGGALVVVLPDDTYRYRPQRGRWSRVSDGLDVTQPMPLLNAGQDDIVAVDLLGGDVHTMVDDRWVSGPDLPGERVEATAEVAGDQIVVWGGMGSEREGVPQGWTLPVAAASSAP